MGATGILLAISAVTTIGSGIAANKASQKQSDLLQEQGQLQKQEADAEAARVRENNRKDAAQQKLRFLKSGVTLAGSPSLVLTETRDIGDEFATSVERRGAAEKAKSRSQAAVARQQGRGALLGSIGGAANTILSVI